MRSPSRLQTPELERSRPRLRALSLPEWWKGGARRLEYLGIGAAKNGFWNKRIHL